MDTIVIAPNAIEHADISKAVAALASGGIGAYPTDTFYGLAVDPRNPAALEKLFQAKQRDPQRASPLIAASIHQAEEAVEFNDTGHFLATRFWPGPLSLVLPAHPAIHPSALGGHTTAAVRVPAHAIAQELARAHGFCVTATSANLSGERPAQSPAEISKVVMQHVDVLIDAGTTPGGTPSTIVDLTERTPRLIRAGTIDWDRVLESLQ